MSMRLGTLKGKRLDRLAAQICAELRKDSPRARVRVLDEADIEEALREHLKGVEKIEEVAKAIPEAAAQVRTVYWGGFVANSYSGFKAEADLLEILTAPQVSAETLAEDLALVDRPLVTYVDVQRVSNCRRSHGKGTERRTEVRLEGALVK